MHISKKRTKIAHQTITQIYNSRPCYLLSECTTLHHDARNHWARLSAVLPTHCILRCGSLYELFKLHIYIQADSVEDCLWNELRITM